MAAKVELRPGLGLGEGYHSPQVEVEVRLNTNESPFPPPPGFVEELAAEVRGLVYHRYPDRGSWALRKAIAELHGVAPQQVWCANGSNEVLQTLLMAYGGPGRTAAVFEPTYAMHHHIATLTGTALALGERGPDFDLDVDGARSLLASTQPEITFVCSPNNPTGAAIPPDVLDLVIEAAPGLVVVDEAYAQFSPTTALGHVREGGAVVVTRTYSKTWSMAAMRLGYLVGPSEVVAGIARASLPYHLSAVTQAAGRLALRYVDDMERRVAALVEERGRLMAGLGQLPVEVWPSDANFVLFRPRSKPGHQVWEELLARSVLIRDCSSWPRLTDCLRVTVGAPQENAAFLEALAEVLV